MTDTLEKEETHQMMTMAEIEECFDGEWVLLEDPYLNDRKEIAGGKLVFHSKNRDEVDAVAIWSRLKHGAFLYMGPMPEHIAINL